MAITIRNKKLEADIKAIGAKYGKGPTEVVRLLVKEHDEKLPAKRQAEDAERLKAIERLKAEARRTTEQDRRDLRERLDEMYDEHGLPR